MAMSAFLDQKLTRRFRSFDVNGNGFVERKDFEAATERMAKAFGHRSDTPAYQKLQELTARLWEGLAAFADTDGDGRISESEYKVAFTEKILAHPGAFDQAYKPWLDTIMEIVDADGDGRLNSAEYLRWASSMLGVHADHAEDAFRRLDRDEDGFINRDELVESIRDYYFSEDPDSTGNWLLGPLK